MARILLIDDVADVRDVLHETLASAGHTVTAIGLGRDAIKALQSAGAFDLVITDILMPDADGLEVIMAAQDLDPKPAIIAISGGGALVPASVTLGGIKLIADAVLQKPFDAAELLAAVDGVVRR